MSLTCTADKIIDHFYMKKIELLHFTVAKKMTTAVEQFFRAIAIRAVHPHSMS
jgi:hypothetical protein